MEKKINNKTLKTRYQDIIPLFKEEKTQNYTTLVLTLIAFSIFGLFAINPTVATILQLRKQIADSQFVSSKLQEKINDIKILQEQYLRLSADLQEVANTVPQTPTIPLLTGQVHALAIKNHLELTRLQILQVELASNQKASNTNPANAGSFIFLLDAQGSATDARNFLSSLINLKRIITIDTVATTVDPEKSSVTHVSLRGKAYFKE